jgi:hypothetical protein
MRYSNRSTVAWRRHAWKAAILAVALDMSVALSSAAQTPELPFDVGERLRYRLQVGKLGTIGEGEMSVSGPVDVRGTETLVLRSEIRAKFGFVKTTDRAESWIDPRRMAALRYQKRTHGAFSKDDDQRVELYPDDQRWEDDHGRQGQSPTTAPLDELSFIYFLRTLPLTSDSVDRVVRHYDPARNPIAVRVMGRDTVRTKAGTFSTIVVEMRVKDPRRYGGEGVIRLYLSDDAYRYPVRIESSVPVLGATVLTLESFTRPPEHFASRPE